MERLAALGGKKSVTMATAQWPQDYLTNFGQDEIDAVVAVMKRGVLWGAHSPEVTAFQREFAEYLGVSYAIAVNSGTAALHCAMAAAGVGPAVEVITTPHTFVASASSVLHQNGVPIFADIDPETYTLDPEKVEEKITEQTKAIEPVHVYGLPADMDEMMKIAKKHDLLVIEDAAQAHGAEYKGRKVGSIGDMAAFSLNGSKNMMAGEGGVFTTNDEELMRKAEMVRVFGEIIRPDVPRDYRSYAMGWNYRMTELQAAIARVQLTKLEQTNRQRIENAEYLTSHLKEMSGFIPQYIPEDRKSVYFHYKIRIDPEAFGFSSSGEKVRDAVVAALNAEGVPAALYQKEPIYMQPLFQIAEGYGKGCPFRCPHVTRKIEYRAGDCPITERISREAFDLTLHPPNDLRLMEEYITAFEKVWGNAERLLELEVKD